MRPLPALAAVLFCLGGLWSPARAATDVELSKACVECHDSDDLPDMSLSAHAERVKKKPPMDAAAAAMQGSPMADATDPRTPNCITCHGASTAHLKKPEGAKERPRPDRVFSKNGGTAAHERSAVCQTCHARDTKNSLWGGSQHDGADVACSGCHKVHTNRDKVMAKATQTEVCYACHKEQRTQLQRVSHHPIPEGRMSCSDCHNVHGSAGPKLALRDSTNGTCYTCHAEKRGPFVHSHEPVNEDCASCHNPHGSTVAAMLKARAPILCQQCHTPHVAGGVGAVGGQSGVLPPARPGPGVPAIGAVTGGKNVVNMWQGRSCTNCHTQVHGSNNPSVSNPTPQFLFR
jgi:DmsE family decaheme c-type cytochrome